MGLVLACEVLGLMHMVPAVYTVPCPGVGVASVLSCLVCSMCPLVGVGIPGVRGARCWLCAWDSHVHIVPCTAIPRALPAWCWGCLVSCVSVPCVAIPRVPRAWCWHSWGHVCLLLGMQCPISLVPGAATPGAPCPLCAAVLCALCPLLPPLPNSSAPHAWCPVHPSPFYVPCLRVLLCTALPPVPCVP